ncbi:hypothetical protein [Micromonospora thermarum]|uniref:Uncharacterized protein n=1 Tax=Micromonospora thermarum TaxID=2720024 RepID=A0ABX0ZE48_9ACTN|nr:hypothetical protein [Micromonospora thermarum]NJP35514.1 hypothetical protein [Micromonospora thermarum]
MGCPEGIQGRLPTRPLTGLCQGAGRGEQSDQGIQARLVDAVTAEQSLGGDVVHPVGW